MRHCLESACSEAGSGYRYENKDTGECVRECGSTFPLLDESGAFCVSSCSTYIQRADAYQCVSRCPADAAKLEPNGALGDAAGAECKNECEQN